MSVSQMLLTADVYLHGTEAQWNAITVGADNDPLVNAKIHFNA